MGCGSVELEVAVTMGVCVSRFVAVVGIVTLVLLLCRNVWKCASVGLF